jgi:hypothetical protein
MSPVQILCLTPSLNYNLVKLRLYMKASNARYGKWICETISNLVFRRNEPDLKLLLQHSFSNKVEVDLNVICSCMEHMIS